MIQYKAVPHRFYQLKDDYSGCGLPKTVSIHGALPRPLDAYKIVTKGYSIYDPKENTYSNYFFGKIGIDTVEEAENIIRRLTAK